MMSSLARLGACASAGETRPLAITIIATNLSMRFLLELSVFAAYPRPADRGCRQWPIRPDPGQPE